MSAESPARPFVARDLPEISRTGYPPPHDAVVRGRSKRFLGDAAGLSQFGVNLTRLSPGAATALAHWHSREDEAVYVLSGEVTLHSGDKSFAMKAGDFIGFPAGTPHGHRIVNDGEGDALLLEVGARVEGDAVTYTEVDLKAEKTNGVYRFSHRDQKAGLAS